jgi:hypothetical protein
MVDAVYARVSANITGVPTSPWANERCQWGFQLRYDKGLVPTWPQQGPLGSYQQDIKPGLEATAEYNIVWAHYAPDLPGSRIGFTQADYKTIAASVVTAFTSMKASMGSQFRLTSVGIASMQGGVDNPAEKNKSVSGTNLFTLKSPVTGGMAQLAPNYAAVVSYRSLLPGRKYKGRSYLGPLGQSVFENTGLMNNVIRGQWLAAMQTLMQTLKNSNRYFPCIVHQADLSYADTRQIAVGDELDVQNRRRNARPETYTTADLT